MTVQDATRLGSEAGRSGLSALVLGGGGFIANHLLGELLTRPQFVRIQAAGLHATQSPSSPRVSVLTGAISPDLLARCTVPDVIFWAAGSSSVGASLQDPAADFALSLPPLSALLDHMNSAWPRSRLLFLSSAAVYGRAATEATAVASPLMPMSPYAVNKKHSEDLIKRNFGSAAGRYTILRPFSVYGPGLRRQLFWDALAKAQRGDLLFHGTGEELRDWLYVGDLVTLLADIAAWPAQFPVLLNAGTGAGTSVSFALRQLFSRVPGAPVPRFTGLTREGDPDRLVASAVEQRAFAGYFQTSLAAGLARYLDWHATSVP